jgi:hypothetical protein
MVLFLFLFFSLGPSLNVICLGRDCSSEGIPHTTAASSLGASGATKGLP